MNYISMKKNCFAVLAFVLLCTQVCSYAGGDATMFQGDERIYVEQLSSEIEDMFEFFRINVTKFIDATDHTPYRTLVLAINGKLDDFEERVVATLAKKLIEARSKNSAVFQQTLGIVHEILYEFMTKVKVLKNIMMQEKYLNTCEGGKSVNLCQELKNCKDIFDGRMMTELDEKIDKLYTLVVSTGDQELTERIKQIRTVLKNFKSGSAKKSAGYELKIVNAVAAKLRHNRSKR